jgi:hypothetical protein
MDLTDRQWTIIEPLFEEKRRPPVTYGSIKRAYRSHLFTVRSPRNKKRRSSSMTQPPAPNRCT